MTDEHDAERFMVVRALHYAHTYEHMTDVAISFVEEWTEFPRHQVLRVVGSLVNTRHVSHSSGEQDSDGYTVKLSSKGRAWVVRQ